MVRASLGSRIRSVLIELKRAPQPLCDTVYLAREGSFVEPAAHDITPVQEGHE
jgi:hypothetical protein